MAHQLTERKNGMVEMGFVAGTARWHGLGNELAEGASIDDWIVTAGMDWKVLRSKVRFATGRVVEGESTPPPMAEWADNHVLFRSDSKAPLGLVSDGFKIVQPREVLEFFRELCATNDFKMRTAGTLFGGRRFWALADIGEESYVLDAKDRVKGRLLLVTACDGSLKTTGKFVSECVVCNNTLTMAQAENGKQIAVSHRSVFNADDVKMKLGLADGAFASFISDMRFLARVPVSAKVADDLTIKLLDDADTEKEKDEVRASRGYKQIVELFNGKAVGSNLKGRSDTAYAWLNAVTEYADHHVTARNDDNRFNSSQFGAGDKLKNDALQLAMAA